VIRNAAKDTKGMIKVERCKSHALPVLVFSLLSLLVLASSAGADFVVGSPGVGAGQYERPEGVAVDASSGHVYVADIENNRVDVYDDSGVFLFAFGWDVNAISPEQKLQTCGPQASPPGTACQRGSAGAAAGQLESPTGITVDSSSHAVYVSENSNHRVQKFDSTGHFEWMVGGEVDKVTHADLCTVPADCGVGQEAEKIVGKEEGRFFFASLGLPVSVGPGGVLYVADSREIGVTEAEGFNTRVQRFAEDGAYLGPQLLLAGEVGRVTALAVRASSELFVALSDEDVRKYDESGGLVTGWGSNGTVEAARAAASIAFDPAGDLFAGRPATFAPAIDEFDPNGVQTRAFFPALIKNSTITGLAFYHSASGDLFATGRVANVLLRVSLPEAGPLLVPGSEEASPVGNVKATLGVSFNPEGKVSHAHFQYISKAAYEANLAQTKEGFAGAAETPESTDTTADFATATVEATNACVVPTEASCLKPETTYYFRAIAANTDGSVTGEKAEYTTRPPSEISATWAGDVGTDSARLNAEVNPLAIHATGQFQYIPEGSDYQANGFQHAQSTGTLDFGSGEVSFARASQITGLQPGTIYHYRLVASDPFFSPVVSAPHTFNTFVLPGEAEGGCLNQALRVGPSAALPDCRAYEMVSPLEKENGDVLTLINTVSDPTNLDQSSTEGTDFTYSSYRAFDDPKGAPYTDQYLARRDPGAGWRSEALDPARGPQLNLNRGLENPYKAFSADLESGWLLQEGEPAPDPCAPSGFAELYHREGPGAFAALSCAPIEHDDNSTFMPEVQGFSADGSHAVFRADEALTADASDATDAIDPSRFGDRIYQVYESSGAGRLRLVSVLPDGEANATESSAGTAGETNPRRNWNFNRWSSLAHAVSEDGTRVFWGAYGSSGVGSLYLRINADQAQSAFDGEGHCDQPARACTIPVSETVSPEPVYFQAGNPQGTGALFKVTQGPLAGNLYRFDAEAKPAASQLIAKAVQGNILGASADLSRVYYVSEEATSQQQSEGAIQDESNVYLADEGTTRFIATLSNTGAGGRSDLGNAYGTPVESIPIGHTARVSADGRGLVFMSNSLVLSERVAGYDNTDINSGQPDAEVYLYDAAANEGKGMLRCVSCDPSGERPLGRQIGPDSSGNGPGYWGAARVPTFETDLYQPRYLSDDGQRVFFDSYGPLVLGDSNGKQDVYQWEAQGSGSCTTESSSYVSASEGCLSLLSSGQNPADSEFLDASASGSDAFFTTSEGLLPQDTGLIDVYDARVDGGFPLGSNPPAVCEGEACQGAPVPPLDTTPASFAFFGPGNPAPPISPATKTAKPKAKTLTRAQKLALALKACHKQHNHAKRKACERQARRKYGPLKAKKAKRK
jgi:hypothetical protein